MNYRQYQLVIGKLLGDGSLENRGHANSRLQIRHSIKQQAYVDWSYFLLQDLAASPPRRFRQAYYFRTRSLPIFTKMRRAWYLPTGRKIIPSFIKLTPFILAVWFMDDGYFDQHWRSFWLCVHCYRQEEIEFLRAQLAKMGLEWRKIRDRNHYKLRLISSNREKFISLVRPYILPSLLYKIGIAP